MTTSHSKHKISHTHKHNITSYQKISEQTKTDILCMQKKKKKKRKPNTKNIHI